MAQKKKGGILIWIVLVALILAAGAYLVLGPNTGDLHTGNFLYIHTGSTYANVKKDLAEKGFINSTWSFDLLAKRAHYPEHIHAGKYRIDRGMSNYHIIRMLHAGKQIPVKLVVNKIRTKKDLAHLAGSNLEADSNTILQLLYNNSLLSEYGLDSNTAMCAIMPNTYEFYWNTDAEKTFRKMAKSYTNYWTDERKLAASNKRLTQQQVIIIASILEEETNKNDEKPNIASVYINRLRHGVRLQADPTIKFAVDDFTLRRITGQYLKIASPYNTYINAGLPPGPICTPSKTSIEAVLNAPETKLMYFCAKDDFSGYHAFAETLTEHQKNAKRYQQALDVRGIH